MAILLRDPLQGDVETVLLEDARFLRKRQGGEAGPPGQADPDFGFLGKGSGRKASMAII